MLFYYREYKQMRNQLHKQKQAITHKILGNLNQMLDANIEKDSSKNQHKSICFIQITDLPETQRRDRHNYFRNTFFGKLGKRSAPKKNFFNTVMDKLKANSSYERILTRKSEPGYDRSAEVSREYSERSSFIIQQLNEAHKVNDRKIRSKASENREETCEEKKEANLVKDIEKLRLSENGYLHKIKQKQLEAETKGLPTYSNSKEQAHPLNHSSSGQIHEDWMPSKQDLILTLREKIKNKQSRKHIYHTLKNKNEVWNKIRFKTHQGFPQRERVSAPQITEEVQSVRLHCQQQKQPLKGAHQIHIKAFSKPHENLHQLRIDSKPCIMSFNSYSPSQSFQISSKEQGRQEPNTADSPSSGRKRLRKKREAYEQIIESLKESKKSKGVNNRCQTGCNPSQANQFRLLTPWKDRDEDAL